MFEAIPEELKTIPNWVCWNAIPDEKSHSGVKKVPICALNGNPAKSNNPETWTDFDNALLIKNAHNFSGVGFMFSESDYFGVDIDDCREEIARYQSGDKSGIIGEFIETLGSYAEISQSGHGIHIICRGTLPPGGRRRGKVEMYDSGRFFVMTGNRIGNFERIADATERIKPLHAKYLGAPPAPKQVKTPVQSVPALNEKEIIDKIQHSQSGEKFARLYSGDFSDYPSHSEADMAFCSMLAFWCCGDTGLMDRIYRSSGLMRDKWDRRQSGSTYGRQTLEKAAASCTNFYQPGTVTRSEGFSISVKDSKGDNTQPSAPLCPEPKYTGAGRKSYIVNKCLKHNEELISRLELLNPLSYHYSDRGSSELFADMFRHEVRYNTTARDWLFYDGKVWKTDTGGMVVHAKAKQLFDALMLYAGSIGNEQTQKLYREYYGKFGSKNKRDTLIKDAADCCYISSEELDRNPNLFNCQNGTFELDTMKFRPHNSEDHITKISNVVYDEKAVSEDWIKFINEVLPCDREKVRYLQKAVGYSLSGTCSLETCFILYGATTRNGKSTFVSTISYMLGDSNGYARAAQPEVLAVRKNKDSRNASEDIARLAGCRFLNVSEPPQSMAFDAALLKTLTGRDTITARFLFQGSFEYVPQFTLFINTNYLPKVLDETLFTSNRINVIEFTRHFKPEEQDIDIKDRLRTEQNISGLFNWCIEGLKLFRQEGLKPPMSVGIATRQYARQSDKIGNFIDECLEEERGSACTAKDAYEVYKKWCAECGYFSEGKQKFMELLRGKNMLSARARVNDVWVNNVIENYSVVYEFPEK